MNPLLDGLAAWKPFDAIVVGDFMLDQIVRGDATRLSADAPVPVLHARDTEDRPGGAANLCLDLAALHGRVHAIGIVGHDHDGDRLRAALAAHPLARTPVDTAGLLGDGDRPTTVKRSLVGLAQGRHPQKMFRLDIESREPVGPDIADRLIDRVRTTLASCDTSTTVVCIEDYGKGVCCDRVCRGVIDAARTAGVPVFVDPAARADYQVYRGATAITPNRTEAEGATGLRTDDGSGESSNASLDRSVAHALLSQLDLDAVVLTLDRRGALLLERAAGDAVAVPTVARDVYDVTGAGDMMVAALAAARVNGLTWPDAVRFANAAAGLEVETFGVEPIALERIHHDLLMRALNDASGERVRTLDQAVVEAAALRSVGKKIVFTNGCFDVLHAGHVALLEQCRTFGDHIIVGLNSDASVRRLKGESRPINPAQDRAKLLCALRAVDAVIIFDDDTPLTIIDALRPDVLIKGADYRVEDVVGRSIVEASGGRVELVDLVQGKSTTAVVERMQSG